MNKFYLLIISLFFLANNANAFENNNFSKENKPNHYGSNPISFIENGIAFYVFPNGQFDFDTPTVQRVVYNNYGHRNANGNCHISGINVLYDYYGRIIRIGNVPLGYDKINRIKRIGSVWMNYNHCGLSNVGGLQIIYNNYNQIITMSGTVNNCGGNNHYDYDYSHYDSSNGYSYYDKDDYKHNGNHESHSGQGLGNGKKSGDRDYGNKESRGGRR